MNSTELWNRMDTIFMNFKNSKTSDPPKLLLNLIDKLNLRDKYVAPSNLSKYYTKKIIKSHVRTINWKFQLQHGMKNLNHLMDHTLHQMFKIILNIYLKNTEKRLLIFL